MTQHSPIRCTARRSVVLALGVLLVAIIGCTGEVAAPPAGALLETCPGEAAAPAPGAVPEIPEEVRVYLDASVSMQGFAGQDHRYGRLLHALRPMLLALDVEQGTVWRVGAQPERIPHRGDFGRYDQGSFYTLGETDLAGALALELEAPRPGLALLVSDGVMSLRQDTGDEGELAECARGSDVHCLGKRVGELVGSGRGFWIVGLRSAFRGPLFSERAAPGGRSLGIVELPDRPFYLWIVADDPVLARRFIASLWDGLGLAADGSEAFVLEIAPGRIPALLPGGAPPAPDRDLLPLDATSGAVMGRVVNGRGGPPRQEVLDNGLAGTSLGLGFGVRASPVAWIPEAIRPSADYQPQLCLRWETSPHQARARVDRREDRLLLALQVPDFEALAGGRAAVLQRLERRQEGATLPDLAAWSTRDDRTVEAANKTLYLDELLAVLRHRVDLPEAYEQPLVVLEFDPAAESLR